MFTLLVSEAKPTNQYIVYRGEFSLVGGWVGGEFENYIRNKEKNETNFDLNEKNDEVNYLIS